MVQMGSRKLPLNSEIHVRILTTNSCLSNSINLVCNWRIFRPSFLGILKIFCLKFISHTCLESAIFEKEHGWFKSRSAHAEKAQVQHAVCM